MEDIGSKALDDELNKSQDEIHVTVGNGHYVPVPKPNKKSRKEENK
jgi:hypothetical protein